LNLFCLDVLVPVFPLGGWPTGFGSNASTSVRSTSSRPATLTDVRRPRRSKSAMACFDTPRILPASACEIYLPEFPLSFASSGFLTGLGLASISFVGRPFGLGTNDSTSERRTRVRPATFFVVSCPLRIKLDIACVVVPTMRAASAMEI
jgi:hypothetical protein